MSDWNYLLPASWAKALGLIAVPLFDNTPRRNTGTHAVMLDGHGSFTLSIGTGVGEKRLSKANEWAWSANVRHALVVDKQSHRAIACDWDRPGETSEWDIADGRTAGKLLAFFEASPAPPLGTTVIDRSLGTFQTIRTEIEERGGSPLDVIIAFNALLAWVARCEPSELNSDLSFQQVFELLGTDIRGNRGRDTISRSVHSYPLTRLARVLREGEGRDGEFILNADLLIRHASGTLYQEAHRSLAEKTTTIRQKNLFEGDVLLPRSSARRKRPQSYVHYTPQSLARLLAEVAMSALPHSTSETPIDVLDPACGSGVFLIESIRESFSLGLQSISIRGFDESNVAVNMADFSVRHVAASFSNSITTDFRQENSLRADWGHPDIVLMNPPFKAWEHLNEIERNDVDTCLGELKSGRPDLSLAFIVRAATALPPGGVLATLVPASFLESRTASKIRRWLCTGDYRVRLIGLFRGFTYFHDAMVEPAFMVIEKSPNDGPVRQVLAHDGYAETAIRWCRKNPVSGSIERTGYEARSIAPAALLGHNWTPQPKRQAEFAASVQRRTPSCVGDFFTPRLGVRLGHKKTFVVTPADHEVYCRTVAAREMFRPTADSIEGGQIVPSTYIFYPYGPDGSLLIRSESQLATLLPEFYHGRMIPNKQGLELRRSHYRNWWEPTEPVATWLGLKAPRIVSKAFGHRGSFALDEIGNHAVVQGMAWCWHLGAITNDVLFAYLAIANSRLFETLLALFCPRVHGGQFNLAPMYIKHVPLPVLAQQQKTLAGFGRLIHNGETYDSIALDDATRRAYRVNYDDGVVLDVEQELTALASEWRTASAVCTFLEKQARHPAFRRIVELGEASIPFVLRHFAEQPRAWSMVMHQIAGPNSVDESIADELKAWELWDKSKGL